MLAANGYGIALPAKKPRRTVCNLCGAGSDFRAEGIMPAVLLFNPGSQLIL